ncbi:uncharacterized protein LOC129975526 [Argiope bruennichi]|uniref:uncharacterized protein LOC129975526 n=1 Tax=Argiope bruennichi TaxID=94029 RepID=UPI002494B00D|nr:uncharacterized protein LOC129975526 [Argiope bruennichi]
MKALKNMQTFKDDSDILKVRTKLILGDEEENFKCPILLPGNHEIIRRLIHQKHCELQHAGLRTLISNLRENYWIISVNKIAKQVSSHCITCKRFKAKPTEPPLAPLPKNRIKVAAAFEVTGIDLAGPLFLRSGEKTWIVLFTCAIYRAVHLELVNSLSTEAFIMALRRFFARRGRVNIIYTDNGTNFVGTSNALKNLDWEKIMSFSTIKKIKWNFNPPTAAWWGGWWERMIRMLKEMLRRILGRKSIDYEELETLICDCEATINSRPLTYIEDNSEGLRPLTPACFLQGIPSSDTTDLDEIDSKSLNRRLCFIQKLRHDLRTRFRNEYLAMLVHKGRHTRDESLNVGDIILLETDGKRLHWPLGIVTEVLTGADGHSRVARVRTAQGEKLRPFQRLYSLEIRSSEKLPFIARQKDKDTNTQLPATPAVSDQDSSEEDDYITKVTPDVVTKAGRRIKIPNRLDL